MEAVIKLEGMEFRARHGCYELEKVVGNRFSVDAEIRYDAAQAAENDDISQSVNYLTAYHIVRKEMDIPSNIIENAALRIARALKEQLPQITGVRITVAKLAPPLGGKVACASATIEL
jgi:dihydroneopterin aldolase